MLRNIKLTKTNLYKHKINKEKRLKMKLKQKREKRA